MAKKKAKKKASKKPRRKNCEKEKEEIVYKEFLYNKNGSKNYNPEKT